jgi:hypothetical protein
MSVFLSPSPSPSPSLSHRKKETERKKERKKEGRKEGKKEKEKDITVSGSIRKGIEYWIYLSIGRSYKSRQRI